MEKLKADYKALLAWAAENQPLYVEKISELEKGNRIVTVAGVQIPGEEFLKNMKMAMQLMKKKKISSRYKEQQKVLEDARVADVERKRLANEKEKKRRAKMEAKEAERRKIREVKRDKKIAEKEEALKKAGVVD